MRKRGACSVDSQAIAEELERILASQRFAHAPQLGRFLRFLVERTLAGGSPIDDFAVAAMVFDRGPAYQPQTDPIVQVQTRQLRQALHDYYAHEGSADAVVISMPGRGFELAFTGEEPASSAAPRRFRALLAAPVLAGAVCVGAGIWAYHHFAQENAESRELYQKARELRAKGTAADFEQSTRYFEQVLERNPRYAQAWSGLAATLIAAGSYEDLPAADLFAKARDAADKALALDGKLAEAHATQAWIRFANDWDWAGAETEFRRAIELDPSVPEFHRRYARALLARRRFDEAISQSRIADANSAAPGVDLALTLCYARRYDEGLAEAKRLLDSGNPAGHAGAGVCLAAKGQYDEAIQHYQAVRGISSSRYLLARLGNAYALKGDRAAAEDIIMQLAGLSQSTLTPAWTVLSIVYAGLGDSRSAVECLQRAIDARETDANLMGVDPAYDRVRSDPGFVALVKRLGI